MAIGIAVGVGLWLTAAGLAAERWPYDPLALARSLDPDKRITGINMLTAYYQVYGSSTVVKVLRRALADISPQVRQAALGKAVDLLEEPTMRFVGEELRGDVERNAKSADALLSLQVLRALALIQADRLEGRAFDEWEKASLVVPAEALGASSKASDRVMAASMVALLSPQALLRAQELLGKLSTDTDLQVRIAFLRSLLEVAHADFSGTMNYILAKLNEPIHQAAASDDEEEKSFGKRLLTRKKRRPPAFKDLTAASSVSDKATIGYKFSHIPTRVH
jgi:hypothetical protein